MQRLTDFFSCELPEVVDGFVEREQQLKLAEHVAAAIASGDNGLFEAGTGIGKTLAYLVPALLGDVSVIISTGTRSLQDQLLLKDMPLLHPLFPSKRVVLLKGRSNYLCPYRLKSKIRVAQGDSKIHNKLMEVRTWWSSTRSGDITELLDPEEDPGLISMITSNRDNCLGQRCPDYDSCPLYRSRGLAAEADIVIVNHHLLFADLAQKEESLQTILPSASAIVVDEAHRIPDIARQFFGAQVSSGQIIELIRDTRTEMKLLGNDDPMMEKAVLHLEQALEKLSERILATAEKDFNRWYADNAQLVETLAGDEPIVQAAKVIQNVDFAMMDLSDHIERSRDRSEGMAQLSKRITRFVDLFALLTEASGENTDSVHWIDRRARGFVIHLSPLSVAQELQGLTSSSETAWIFLSATLSVDKSFDHFRNEMGLPEGVGAVFPSPFDYRSAVKAYIPMHLPEPTDASHTEKLVEAVTQLINVNAGRTFFLFTSHQALRKAAGLVADKGWPVFVQGTMSRARLIEAFVSTPNAVLLATQSFWEGIDVRGADLNCVIIDKLPFPNPSEPVLSAQARLVEAEGGNSFVALSLPSMLLSLKQGFGRLMRQESDRGLFVLGDTRLVSRSYRDYVVSNLPEMQWLASESDAADWLRQL